MSIFCTHCWGSHPQDEHRRGTSMGCPTCRVTFYSGAAFRRHRKDPTSRCSPSAVSEYRCCDCDKEFGNARKLYTHLAVKHPNFREPPPDRNRGLHYCDECRKSFGTKKALKSHRANARVHNPLLAKKVGCLGGCKRKFDAPSSLLAHLESGFCKSGMTRDKLDRAIIAEDKTNIITDVDAVLARHTKNLSLASSDVSSICDSHTPDDSSGAAGTTYGAFGGHPGWQTTGGVSLTPDASSNEASSSSGGGAHTTSGSSTGTATPTAGVSGGGGISINPLSFLTASFSSTDSLHTPSTSSTASNQPVAEPTLEQLQSWLLPDGTFACPMYPDPPSFPLFAELQTHMQSPAAYPQLNHDLNSLFLDPPISTASSESGIATPSATSTNPYLLPNGKYECPMCPSGSRRQFGSLAVLRDHMFSPIAHMPKIYHCPDPALLGIVLPPGTKIKTQKSFLTLSGLAQHVEYNACQGRGLMFKAVVGFVNEKLADLGMGDMRMIAAE